MDQAGFDFGADPGRDGREDPAGPGGGAERAAASADAADAEPTFSVGELNQLVRGALRRAFPAELWVRGEVQNLNRSAAGHVYFALVEKAAVGHRVQSRLDVALFRDQRRAVERALAEVGAELSTDLEVRVRGRVDVYPASGRYQLVVSGVDPVFTAGGIAAARERVLRALAAEGLLEANGRLPLPALPLRVGLVTSRGSAAYHDFVDELRRAAFAFEVVCVDVRVQGAAAARRISWGLRALAAHDVDVVVLARGGGSRADLAPFDSDVVARAIAAMPVPVVTGVGHEVDRSVADVAAHTACKTPTACAQLLVGRVRDAVDALDRAAHLVSVGARRRGALAARDLDETERRVLRLAPGRLARAREQLDDAQRRVAQRSGRVLVAATEGVAAREHAIARTAGHGVARASLALDAAAASVRALDPQRVLERGYSITRDESGVVLRSVTDAPPGVRIVSELVDGRVDSRVEDVHPREER